MDSREVEQRLQQWVRPSTQPAYLRGGIDHPVVDDVAAAADSLATERQAREAAEAEIERMKQAIEPCDICGAAEHNLRANKAEARAERLAEALRDCLTTLDGLSNDEGLDPDSAILLSETYTRGRTTLQSEEK